MKRFALLCALAVCFAGVASAQDYSKVDVFAGYSFVHTSQDGFGFDFNGGSASVAYNPNAWLGLVGDFGGYHSNSFNVGETVYTYMFGPRLNLRRGKFTPFAQALFGGAHASIGGECESCRETGGANAFAMALGGGVDYNATARIA